MGDRANVKIKESTGRSIYVYTHWHGHDFPAMLQDALRFAKGRWTDESYFQRCIITQLCSPAKDATGFGVSTYPTDNERDILEVESEEQKVRLLSQEGFHKGKQKFDWEKNGRNVIVEWTFEEYCGLDLSDSFESLRRSKVTANAQ